MVRRPPGDAANNRPPPTDGPRVKDLIDKFDKRGGDGVTPTLRDGMPGGGSGAGVEACLAGLRPPPKTLPTVNGKGSESNSPCP